MIYEECDRATIENPDAGKLKLRGMSAVRRDNFAFKRNLEMGCIKLLLDLKVEPDQAMRNCIDFIHSELRRLANGNVPLNELTVNYSLSKPLEDYGEQNTPNLAAARLINKANPDSPLEPGDRFHVLMGFRPGQPKTAKKADMAVDVATFLREDYMLDVQHYIDSCRNDVCSLMSIFFIEREEREIRRQTLLLPGRRMTVESALASKVSKRAFGVKKEHAEDKRGHTLVEKEFFENLKPNQKQLMTSLWNPYYLREEDELRKGEFQQLIRGAYTNLGTVWDGSLDDPISIFSIADPNLYKQYYAVCKLRALENHPLFQKRQKQTVHSVFKRVQGWPAPQAIKRTRAA